MSHGEPDRPVVLDGAQKKSLERVIRERFTIQDPAPVEVVSLKIPIKELKQYAKQNKLDRIICVNVSRELIFPASQNWREKVLLELIQAHGGRVEVDTARNALGMEELKSSAFNNVITRSSTLRIVDSHLVPADHVTRKKKLRTTTDLRKKKAIAQAIMSLLLGQVKDIPTSLSSKLTPLWQKKPERLLALDGGTTNDEVAAKLADLPRSFSHLSILTNSPDVADIVSQRKSIRPTQHTVIQIGGKLRHESEAYVGALAQSSVDAMNLRPDVAIVAATEMNSDGEFGSSDEDESRIKARMLGRQLTSSLRGVDLDSSKILRMRGIAWLFASFADIDFIVTDEDIIDSSWAVARNENKPEVDRMNADSIMRNFRRFWELVGNHQLPVLAGDRFYLGPVRP
jgi:DeoR/GlpR family transcriptional regulator of sugar metabolism